MRYVTPNEVQLQGIRLGKQIESRLYDFKPTIIVPLLRGGAPLSMYIQGYLEARGIHVNYAAVRTSSYTAPGQQESTIDVYSIEDLIEKCDRNDHVLIVDDVFEKGRSIEAVLAKMKEKMGEEMPTNIRIAVGFWKPKKNQTQLYPNYYDELCDDWLVFGHEFDDMETPRQVYAVMGEQVYNAFIAPVTTPKVPT